MSRKERDRLKVMGQLRSGQIGQGQAAQWLSLSVRQVRRILRRYEAHGDSGLIHLGRNRPSNRQFDPVVVEQAKGLLRTRYRDFGPTLASERLAHDNGLLASRESVRHWMRQEALWGGQRRPRPHRRRRPRRAAFGELIQMDTSEHDWLEGRGEPCALITMIDDATGNKLIRFFPADTTAANLSLIMQWLKRHGRPLALYTDRASHFRQIPVAGRKTVHTQIERALAELDIHLICAHSPQAKGRVERSHGTDQDRLVKELRLAGATTIEAANRFVQEDYLPRVNEKFAVPAACEADAHRSAQGFDLEAICSLQERRRVRNDYTVQVDGVAWQIEAPEITKALAGSQAIIERRLDGAMRIRWQDRYLKHHRAQIVCNPSRKNNEIHSKQTPLARRGESPFRDGSLREPSLHSDSPLLASPQAYPLLKPKAKKHKPSPEHPWRNRTFLLCAKPDISTLP